MQFDLSVIVDAVPALMHGARLTVLITIAGLAGGTAAHEEAASRIQTLESDLVRAQREAETLRADLEAASAAAAAARRLTGSSLRPP